MARNCGSSALYSIHRIDDVGVGCFKRKISTAWSPSEIPRCAVFDRVDAQSAKSIKPYSGAILIGDDQRTVFRGLNNLVGRRNDPGRLESAELAFGALAFAVGKRGATSIEANTVFIQDQRISFDSHGRARGASYEHLPMPSICESFCARMESAASYI